MRKKYILIASISICLFIALFPYLFSLLHVMKIKRDLNNPIINNDYQNWHSVSLDDNIEIKIPDAWSLKLEEPLTIYDSTGTPVAIGLKLKSCSEEQWMNLLSDCSSQTVVSYSNAFFSSNRFGNLASVWWAICEFESGQKRRIVSLKLPYYDYDYYFCFICDSKAKCNEAEAIAYSMSYNK